MFIAMRMFVSGRGRPHHHKTPTNPLKITSPPHYNHKHPIVFKPTPAPTSASRDARIEPSVLSALPESSA